MFVMVKKQFKCVCAALNQVQLALMLLRFRQIHIIYDHRDIVSKQSIHNPATLKLTHD